VKVHERVDVPEPVTLVGDRPQDVLLVARLTISAKPLTGAIVTVDVPVAFTFTLRLVGLAVSVKSWTVKVTVTMCERLPLVPVTPTWKVPIDVNEHDRVDVPEPVTLAGDMVQDVLLVARLTIPAKPLTADTVMLDVPAAFTFTLTLVGLAAIVKSCTTKVTVRE